MIRDNQRYLNLLHVILDGAIVALSYMLAWYVRFISSLTDFYPAIQSLTTEVYFGVLYYLVPAYIFLYLFFSVYTPKRVTLFRYELWNIIKVNTAGVIGFLVALYIFKVNDYSRGMIFIFTGINILLTSLERGIERSILRAIRRNGHNLKHVLMLGYSRAAENYIARIQDNPQWGYMINGILDDYVPIGTKYRDVRVVGKTDELQVQLKDNTYDEIIVALPLDQYDRLEKFVDLCEKSGVHTKFIPDYNSLFPSNPYTEDVLGIPVISIRYVPLTVFFNKLIKRITDILGSIVAVILFSPVMLFALLAVKLTSKGPVIYRQERVGIHGKPFMMYKFRTMYVQDKEEEKSGWTTKGDPRVTPVGKFLRSSSIDEMPQFFNVLFGQMSLVGPRPERPQFVEKFKEEVPRYMIKHQVRPGITGWAQINGYRGDTSIRKRIEYDIYYIENWTYFFDIRILFGTIFHGFRNKNAY